jgi:hypothetical protein
MGAGVGANEGAASAARPLSAVKATLWAGVVLAAMLVLVACSEQAGGAGDKAPGDLAGSGSPLEKVVACDLLSDKEAASVGPDLESAEEPEGGASSSCGWNTRAESETPLEDSVSVGIKIRPGEGLDGLASQSGDQEQSTTVGNQQAKRTNEGGESGTCTVGIAVSGGRVDVISVMISGDTNRSCANATAVAKIIEPKLPE